METATPDQKAILGQRIRAAREERRWSVRELGRRSGVSAPTVLRYEAGRANKFKTLSRLLRGLGEEWTVVFTDAKTGRPLLLWALASNKATAL